MLYIVCKVLENVVCGVDEIIFWWLVEDMVDNCISCSKLLCVLWYDLKFIGNCWIEGIERKVRGFLICQEFLLDMIEIDTVLLDNEPRERGGEEWMGVYTLVDMGCTKWCVIMGF